MDYRRNSGSRVFEFPVRGDTLPCLIRNGVFWRTPCAETPKNGVSEIPVPRNSGSGVFEVPVRSVTPPCLIGNEVFWRNPRAETPKTEFLRFPCAETPAVEFLRFRAQRYSTVPYRERGFLAHPVRRNSKHRVSEVPVRRDSGSGVLRFPCVAKLHRAL